MTNQQLRQFAYKAIAEYNGLALKLLSQDWYKKKEGEIGIPHGLALSTPDGTVAFLPAPDTPTRMSPQMLASAMIVSESEGVGFLKLSSSPRLDDPETRLQVFKDYPNLTHRSELARRTAMSEVREAYKDHGDSKRIFAMFASSYECMVFTAEYDEDFEQFVNIQQIDEDLLYPGERHWVDHLINVVGGLDVLSAKLDSLVDTSEESIEEQKEIGKTKIAEAEKMFRENFAITEKEFEQRVSDRYDGRIKEIRCAEMPRSEFMNESRNNLFS